MKQAIMITNDDIKQMLAEKFKVDAKNVIKGQYSWTIVDAQMETPTTPTETN